MDKLVLDLATQSFSDEVKHLLITLLNEGNQVVKEAHASERGQELMARTITDPFGPKSATPQKRQASAEPFISEPLTPRNRQASEQLSAIDAASNMDGADADGVNDADVNDADNDYIPSKFEENLQTSKLEDTDNKVSENKMDVDRVSEDILEVRTTKKWHQDLLKQPVSVQEAFDQDNFNLRQLLALSPKKVYGIDNLEDEKTLDRALRLLYMAKFGQLDMNTWISPHIQYNKLPIAVANSIASKLKVEEGQVRDSLAIVGSLGKLYILNSTLQLTLLLTRWFLGQTYCHSSPRRESNRVLLI